MKKEKKIRKNVTFNFYTAKIDIDKDEFNKWFATYNNSSKDHISSVIKKLLLSDTNIKLSHAFNAVINGKVDEVCNIGEKLVELDKSTVKRDNKTIFFQLTNFRDTNIPSIKAPKQDREEIALKDDEYIGEFMSILYHLQTDVLMVQSNRYSLVKGQLEMFLTLMFFSTMGIPSDFTAFMRINLISVMDENLYKKITRDGVFQKIHIKGNRTSLYSFAENKQKSIYGLRKIVEDFEGTDFEIIVRKRTTKTSPKPLDAEVITDLFEEFSQLTQEESTPLPQIETTIKTGDYTESIDWLTPQLKVVIPFTIKPKQTLGYEVLFNEMSSALLKVENRLIKSLLGPVMR